MVETIEAHEEGRKAALRGEDFWHNPHSVLSGSQQLFHAWFAGWCYGTQQQENGLADELEKVFQSSIIRGG